MHAAHSSFGLLVATFLLGATGCGGKTDSDQASNGKPVDTEVTPETGEIFLRNTNGTLDLVRVDLVSGARGRIADPLPVHVSESAVPMLWTSPDGSRAVVSVDAPDHHQSIFVLDRSADGTAHFRTLAENAMFSQPSEDASIVTFVTGESSHYLFHVVRYDGENVATIDAPGATDLNVYPALAAISPKGRWIVIRRSLDDLAAYAIPEHGPATGPAVPKTTRRLTPLCATSSAFIATAADRTAGPDAYWLAPSFDSLDVRGFLGTRSKITSRLNSSSCGFQVDGQSDAIRTVSRIDDESLSSGFTFDGKLGDLLDATSDHWLVMNGHYLSTALSLGSTKTSQTVATYVPLPTVRPVPAGYEAQRMVTVLTHSLGKDRQTIALRVRTDIAKPDAGPADAPTPFEETNELWVVEGGAALPTVRLAEGPWVDKTGWPKIPGNYLVSKDGNHLYWTNSDSEGHLRVTVRDLPKGDNERVLDGTLFTPTKPIL